MGISEIFELRQEFQDLIVDIILTLGCSCAAAPGPEAAALDPRACLSCRARWVLILGRRARGWNEWPALMVAHTAGPVIGCVQWRPRAKPALVVLEQRQACPDCAVVLRRGATGTQFFRPGETVRIRSSRTLPLASLAEALTGRNPREGEPGEISCVLPKRVSRLRSVDMAGSAHEIRVPDEGVDRGPGGRRLRP